MLLAVPIRSARCIGVSSYDIAGIPSTQHGAAVMNAQRLAECNELAETTEDPVDRRDFESQKLSEWYGSYTSADAENLQMWRRVLTASIQPSPSIVENPVMRSLVDPKWLGEVYRGTREDARRLLRTGHRKSRSASRLRLSALGSQDLTKLGSSDAAASSGLAAPQETPEEVQVRLRIQR